MRSGLVALCVLVTLWGCGATPQDVEELKKNQKDILAKLEQLSSDVKAAARPAPAAPPGQPDPNKIYTIAVGNSATKGPKDAKVKIVEFSDYQCPFCGQADVLLTQVLSKNPDVEFVYKNFPLTSIHPNALPAAKAALAAGKQGKYWEMHDLLFKNQRALGADQLKDYAKQAGLDVGKWEKDMNSPEVVDQINAEMREAQAAEVRGTPTLFINGKRVQNRSVDGLQQMIDAAKKG